MARPVAEAAGLPFGTGPRPTPGPLHLGVRRVEVSSWLEPASAAEVAEKRALLDTHPDAVQWEPGSLDAQAELAGLVAEAVGQTLPEAEPPILAAARLVADDLLLVAPEDRVVAGAVAAPNRWHLAEKIGLPLAAVHGPVPGYAEVLDAGVGRVLRSLAPGRVLERRGWALLDDPALHQPDGRPVALPVDPSAWWVRIERQTLRRLPATGAVCFTIRTRQWPFRSIAADAAAAADLAQALEGLSPALAAYKSLDLARPALLAALRA